MKKCGAKPIVDTYVQMAHAINTFNANRPETVPASITSTLELTTRFLRENFRNPRAHKGIGILLAILRSASLSAFEKRDIDKQKQLRDTAKLIWDVASPDPTSTMPEEEIQRALQNYSSMLELSPEKRDWEQAADLLTRLAKLPPSNISRNIAIAIARKLRDLEIAEPFWKTLPNEKYDPKIPQLQLLLLSKPETSDPKRALAALDAIIADQPVGQPPVHVKHYILALLSCIPEADVHIAWQIYERMQQNPIVKHDFAPHSLFFDIFVRARRIWKHQQYTLGAIYKPVFSSNLSRFFDDDTLTVHQRFEFAQKFIKLIGWRLKQHFEDEKYREQVQGDFRRFKGLEEYFKRKSRADDLAKGVKKEKPPKIPLRELGKKHPIRVIETNVRTGDQRTVYKYHRAPKQKKPAGTRGYATVTRVSAGSGFSSNAPASSQREISPPKRNRPTKAQVLRFEASDDPQSPEWKGNDWLDRWAKRDSASSMVITEIPRGHAWKAFRTLGKSVRTGYCSAVRHPEKNMGEMEHNPSQQGIQRNISGQFSHETDEEFGDFDTRLPGYKRLPESGRLSNARSKAKVRSLVDRISARSEYFRAVSSTKVQTSESSDTIPAADEPVPPSTLPTPRMSSSELTEAPQPPESADPGITDKYEEYMAELLITQPSTQKFKQPRDFGGKKEPFRVTQKGWSERHQKGWELARRGEKRGETLHKTSKS